MNSPFKRISHLLLLLPSFVLCAVPAMAEEFDASLLWSQRTGLGTPVSGVVETVFVTAGDKVKKGEKLVQLDKSVFEAHVSEFEARLKSAHEHYLEAKRERDRALELYDRTVLSEHDLQMAKNNLTSAKARLEKVRATLKAKQFDLKYSAVRAPFDVVVLSSNAQPGQVIATQYEQQPLVIVAAADKMIARIHVAENQLPLMDKGRSATVLVGDRKYNGTIRSIGLEVVANKKAAAGYPVDVEFMLEGSVLRSGQSARVIIE